MNAIDVKVLIYDTLAQLSEQNPELKFERVPETALTGPTSQLDSLSLVNFLLILEKLIEEKVGKYVSIANEKLLLDSNNPLNTVASLATYIEVELNDK